MRPEADVGDRGRNLGMVPINECRDRRPKSLLNISNFPPRQRRALSIDRAGCSTLGQASHMPASKISLRMIASSRSLFLACVPLSSSVPQGAVLRQRQRNVSAELMRGFAGRRLRLAFSQARSLSAQPMVAVRAGRAFRRADRISGVSPDRATRPLGSAQNCGQPQARTHRQQRNREG